MYEKRNGYTVESVLKGDNTQAIRKQLTKGLISIIEKDLLSSVQSAPPTPLRKKTD